LDIVDLRAAPLNELKKPSAHFDSKAALRLILRIPAKYFPENFRPLHVCSARTVPSLYLRLVSGNAAQLDIQTCATLPSAKRHDIFRAIRIAFARALTSESDRIGDFLKHFPEVANERRGGLLPLLDRLLSKFNEAKLPLIGHQMTSLCPKRVSSPSGSIRRIDSGKMPDNSILQLPIDVLSLDPHFWKDVADDKDYPEMVPASVRFAAFREIQRRKTRKITLPIVVRRSHILENSLQQLRDLYPAELLYVINTQYHDEIGDGVGGLRRDWFTRLTTDEISQSGNGVVCAVNPESQHEKDYLAIFRFAGRIVARAFIEGFRLPISLCRSLLNDLLGVRVRMRDMEKVCNSLTALLRHRLPGVG
jgi:hypothetical protein